MKTARRHELQTNALALRIGRWLERAKPYNSAVSVVLIVAVVAIIVGYFIRKQTSEHSSEAWEAYFLATETFQRNPDDLRKVADAHAGTPVEVWARLAAADHELRMGAALLFRDKTEAAKHLNAAKADYRELKQNAGDDLLRQRATFSLAESYEALNQFDQAREEYLLVTGPLAKAAQERAKTLEEEKVLEFYDWFADAKLPAPPIDPDAPGTPGQRPAFEPDEPGTSPLGIPASIDDPLPPEGEFELPSIPDVTPDRYAPEKPAEEAAEAEPSPGAEPSEPPADDPATEKPE